MVLLLRTERNLTGRLRPTSVVYRSQNAPGAQESQLESNADSYHSYIPAFLIKLKSNTFIARFSSIPMSRLGAVTTLL
jgi:hypothetical protein